MSAQLELHSFDDVLTHNQDSGNKFQQFARNWIWIDDPQGTQAFLEALQVDKFGYLVKLLVQNPIKKLQLRAFQSNYTLASPDLTSLADFAINKSSLSEAVHMLGLLVSLYAIFEENIVTAPTVALTFIHLYCVLLQRYQRARIIPIIDHKLGRGESIDPNRYNDYLGVLTP